MQAVVDQVKRVTLTSRAFRNDQLPLLYKQLHDLTGYDMSLPMNSGAEAVETALKAARKWGYTVKGIPTDKAEIIVCADNFHGRTTTIISFSTDEQYRDGFGPLTPGFVVIPYGDAAALEAAITPNTAAFLVEPIQGEAGIIIPPAGFLKKAEALCKAQQRPVHLRRNPVRPRPHRQAVRAPVGGRPRPTWSSSARRSRAASTPSRRCSPTRACWASSSPATTAARSAATRWRAPWRAPRCRCSSTRSWSSGRPSWASTSWRSCSTLKSPVIKEVRGRGLWIGVELTVAARPYCERLMQEGMLCKETHDHVIRLAPPLVITRDEIDWAVERTEEGPGWLAADVRVAAARATD